jgi:stage II sporulation protein D
MIKPVIYLLILLINSFFIHKVSASEIPTTARVGLEQRYKNTNSVFLGNKNISVGYGYSNKFDTGLNFYSDNGFTIKHIDKRLVKLGVYSNAKDATSVNNMMLQKGYVSSIGIIGYDEYTVFLTEIPQNDLQYVAENVGGTIASSNTYLALIDNDKIIMIFGDIQPQISPLGEDKINLGDRTYRGVIELLNEGNTITVINVLPVTEYLYSVVPSEMPSSWGVEALKAQAVVARNYVWQRTFLHVHSNYTVCDTIHCQVYLGVVSEDDRSNNAVIQTENVKITYDNKPIEAVYYSSNGGSTADSENVWLEKLNYLRSIQDVYEKEHKTWTRTFTLDDINDIATKKNVNIGNITSISITDTESLGRVNELTLTGSKGEEILQKEEVRTFFNASSDGSLDSRNFTIANGIEETTNNNNNNDVYNLINIVDINNIPTEMLIRDVNIFGEDYLQNIFELTVIGDNSIKTYNATSNINSGNTKVVSSGNKIVFEGKGWGHGVGMSQYGAKGMSEEGYTFEDILNFYFRGVDISYENR